MFLIEHIINEIITAQNQGRLQSLPGPTDETAVYQAFYSGGQKQFEYPLKQGRLHGKGRRWYASGETESEIPFYKGTLHGLWRVWFQNGQMEHEAHFTNGCYHGQYRQWYSNGQRRQETHYHMGRIDGMMTEFYENGMIKDQIPFLNGNIHGIWYRYSQNGKILSKELYVHGQHISGRIESMIARNRLTGRLICKIQNRALRRICLNEIGYSRFLAHVSATTIDREEDARLMRVDWHKDEEPLFLVKVQCPSTQVFYTLRVPPFINTVKEAVAWTFELTRDQYQPMEET